MTPLRVVHHTYLERRGGATAVARMLFTSAAQYNQSATLCFEVRQSPDDEELPQNVIPYDSPAALQAWDQADIIHLHASGNWEQLLASACNRSASFFLTTHDASLITGGCPYPYSCKQFYVGCNAPCPLGFPFVEQVWRTRRTLLHDLKPTLVSPSAWLAKKFRKALPDIRIRIVPNGIHVPEKLLSKEQAKARLGVLPQTKTVLFVAHGGPHAGVKGGDRIGALFKALHKRDASICAFVIGGFEHQESEGIHFLPYVEGEMLSLLYQVADVFVYPTRADNHPLVVLEAMGHGAAVVSYAVGGVPEQIRDNEEGILVPAGDEAKLVSAVFSLLSPPAKAHAMGARARERCLHIFRHTHMAKQYETLYRR